MRIMLILSMIVFMAGCQRTSPEDQVKDAKICRDGGMTAISNTIGQISCRP